MNVLLMCDLHIIKGVNIDSAGGVVALDPVVCRAAERERAGPPCNYACVHESCHWLCI